MKVRLKIKYMNEKRINILRKKNRHFRRIGLSLAEKGSAWFRNKICKEIATKLSQQFPSIKFNAFIDIESQVLKVEMLMSAIVDKRLKQKMEICLSYIQLQSCILDPVDFVCDYVYSQLIARGYKEERLQN